MNIYYTTTTASLPPTPIIIADSKSDPELVVNEVCEAMQVARVLLNSKNRIGALYNRGGLFGR